MEYTWLLHSIFVTSIHYKLGVALFEVSVSIHGCRAFLLSCCANQAITTSILTYQDNNVTVLHPPTENNLEGEVALAGPEGIRGKMVYIK